MVEVVRPYDQQLDQYHVEWKKGSQKMLSIPKSNKPTMVEKQSEARKETNKLGKK